MKRTKVELKLKRRLELIRTTVRELSPEQLRDPKGGAATYTCDPSCSDPYT
jgi:hypothetical protein